jgi:hypothetical protein
MTGFDNGPEDGDFVRYIDALLAARAAVPSQSVRDFDPRSAMASAVRSASSVPGTSVTSAQAASIAAAMIRGAGPANAQAWVSLAALLLGIALMVGGWIGAAFSAPFAFAGAALAYWALRRFVGSTRASSISKP